MFKLCYHLNPKRNNLGRGLSSKENGEEDGNEKIRKFRKDCNVEALIVICQGDGAPKLF
jgi:hypothetical protein